MTYMNFKQGSRKCLPTKPKQSSHFYSKATNLNLASLFIELLTWKKHAATEASPSALQFVPAHETVGQREVK